MKLRLVLLTLSLLPILIRPARAADMAKIKELVREKFPRVRSITPVELDAWLADTNRLAPLLVDVRSPQEFDVSHLQNAIHADKFTNRTNLARPIVAYCSVGYRSAEFVTKLQKSGITNALNLEGSIFQWANEGRPVFRGNQPVTEVHPYSRKWGQLLRPQYHPRH